MPKQKQEAKEKKLRVNIWISESEYSDYQNCANQDGRSFSNWARTVMNTEAKKPKYTRG